jgi:CBS domain-containing protein
MTLHDILRAKGSLVHSIAPEATLEDVLQRLTRFNVGSLVVCDADSNLVGIITERDILRACAAHRGPLDQLHVKDSMTTELVTASPEDSVEDTMGLMTQHRKRHLPILSDNKLVGLISIGDVVKAQHDSLSMENHFLKTYINS